MKAARGQTAMTFALTNGCNAIVDILDKHQAILDAEEAILFAHICHRTDDWRSKCTDRGHESSIS